MGERPPGSMVGSGVVTTLLSSDRDHAIDRLTKAWKQAAVIDPDTCRMVIHATRDFHPVLVPFDRALLMLRDAELHPVEGLVGLSLDGTYYEFPGVAL